MKDRQPESKVARLIPPPELRMFTDPSEPARQDADLGVNVFPDRDAWLAGRREWEQANGISLEGWFEELMDEVRADMHDGRCTLAESNGMFRYYVEPDDWTDPRLGDRWMS